MTRDFTLEKYSELMLALTGNYKVVTVADHLTMPATGDVAVVVHPVCRNPERAARMALLEKRIGVRSTYYFEWDPKSTYWPGKGEERFGNFPELQVTEVKLYGHEVGYSPLEGEDVASRLARLRKLAPVRTSFINVPDEDILGGPFSEDFSDFARFVFSGKRWSGPDGKLRGTDELIEILRSKAHPSLMLIVQPDAWK